MDRITLKLGVAAAIRVRRGLSLGASMKPERGKPASVRLGTESMEERIHLFERDLIIDAIKRCNGNLAAAARDIKTTGRIIRYKVKELGIDSKRYYRKRS